MGITVILARLIYSSSAGGPCMWLPLPWVTLPALHSLHLLGSNLSCTTCNQPPYPADPHLSFRQQHEDKKPYLHVAWSYHIG
jgi:hypothetical protein